MSRIWRTTNVEGMFEPTGPWNWSVEWNGLVFVSGIRGIEPQSGEPAEGDERRLELIFDHLSKVLGGAGSSLSSVLSSTVYVTDMTRLRPLVNDAYTQAFGSNPPTRTIVEIQALNQNDSIEIEVIAAKEESNGG